MRFKKRTIVLVVGFFLTFLTKVSFANDQIKLQTNWPKTPRGLALEENASISGLVAYLYEWGISLGIILFFAMILYAGFEYLISQGTPSKISSARKRIVSGFSGIVLLLGSFLILNTINPDLTEIRDVGSPSVSLRSHENAPSENLPQLSCEFSFIRVQEKERRDEISQFMIPNMSFYGNRFRPLKSVACVPEIDEKEILDVVSDKDSGYSFLRKTYSREELDEENRAYQYFENGEGVIINRRDENFIDKAKNNWCSLICQGINCAGWNNICDYNIANNIHKKNLEVDEYIEALSSSSFDYSTQYIENRRNNLNHATDLESIKSQINFDLVNGLYERNPDYNEELKNLYSQRYQEIDSLLVLDDQKSIEADIRVPLLLSLTYNNYNAFVEGSCDNLTSNPKFNRVRCLELTREDDGTVIVKEWRRVGYASLTRALDVILENPGDKIVCPDASSLYANTGQTEEYLGFQNSEAGANCFNAFFSEQDEDGQSLRARYFLFHGEQVRACSGLIVEVSAENPDYRSSFNREPACVSLTRHDPPLEMELGEDLKPMNEVVLNRSQVTNYQQSVAVLKLCEGHIETESQRFDCSLYPLRTCGAGCQIEKFSVPEGEYTVLLEGSSPNYSYTLTTTGNCQNSNNLDNRCLLKIEDAVSFQVAEEEIQLPPSEEIYLNSPETRSPTLNATCSILCDRNSMVCESIGTNPDADNNQYVGRNIWGCRQYQGNCNTEMETPIMIQSNCPSSTGEVHRIQWTYCKCVSQ